MKIYYILFISFVLCYILYRYFNETFNYENFDPSLVPVSSIIRLAKYTQQLVNGGDLSYVNNINIKSNNPTSLLVNNNLNISGVYNSVGSTIINNPIVLKPALKYSDTPGFTLNSPLDIQRSGLNFIDATNENLEFNMFATRSDEISYSYYSESGNALKIYTSNPSDPTNTLKQLMSIDGIADGYGLLDRITINELKTSIINSADNIISLSCCKTESNYSKYSPVYMNGNVQLSNSRKVTDKTWYETPQNNINGIYVIGDVVPNPNPLDTSVINLSYNLNALQINGELKVPRLEVSSAIFATKSDGKFFCMTVGDNPSPYKPYNFVPFCINQFYITNHVGEHIFMCYPPDTATNTHNDKSILPGINIPLGNLNTNWDGGDNYTSGFIYSNNINNPSYFSQNDETITLNLKASNLNKCDNIILSWWSPEKKIHRISGTNVVNLSSQDSGGGRIKIWLKNGIDYNVGDTSNSLTITYVDRQKPFVGYIGI